LRESGSIEQDADMVGLSCARKLRRHREEKAETEGKATLIIAKQRNVRSATCRLHS